MPDIPRVTVLGSCRVYDPFRRLAERGAIELRNRGVYGYVHYAKESVQQLEVMRGQKSIPLSLKPYITHKVLPPNANDSLSTHENHLTETDLLVVEVSSLKEIEFDGYYLQINRLREQLVGDRPSLKEWWTYLYDKGLDADESRRRDRRQFLTDDLTSAERDIVVWANVRIQDEMSLHADMRKIASGFSGPILWVTHFDTQTFAGKPIPIRKTLVRYAKTGAEAMGQPWFNPRPLIERFGMHEALLDLAHYKPKFEEALADHFLERCLPRALENAQRREMT